MYSVRLFFGSLEKPEKVQRNAIKHKRTLDFQVLIALPLFKDDYQGTMIVQVLK